MENTFKKMIVEHDDHPVMCLEIIDDAGNITDVKARAVNIKHESVGDILITASPEMEDGIFRVAACGVPGENNWGRLMTYHSCANNMEIDIKLIKHSETKPDESK
ncbi:MAG: hypothetical protein GY761_15655 [Hyphomicrobiales bacterium]|nr:hypothetical protein [Hyphomicrobiales bacterium]